jgi:hypothetical protein
MTGLGLHCVLQGRRKRSSQSIFLTRKSSPASPLAHPSLTRRAGARYARHFDTTRTTTHHRSRALVLRKRIDLTGIGKWDVEGAVRDD